MGRLRRLDAGKADHCFGPPKRGPLPEKIDRSDVEVHFLKRTQSFMLECFCHVRRCSNLWTV